MKHSLWRLISSFYILLISGLMVIISAYAWMVISKAPGISGSSINVNIPKVFYDMITVPPETLENFPLEAIGHTVSEDDKTIEFKIDSAEDFYVVMRAIDDGDIPQGVENVKLRLTVQISLEDTSVWSTSDWQGIETSALNITIYADTNALGTSTAYIYRMPDTLFQSVNTGSVAFYDVTILEAEITGDGHVGAFVSHAGEQSSVSLINCHVIDSTLVSKNASAGGLIGYAQSANVLIKDCTVKGSSVGVMLGTINGGETVIANVEPVSAVLFANPRNSSNALYGFYDDLGMLNLVDTELATVDVYGGFIQAAADCFAENTFSQTWTVYGTSTMTNEIRFQGNHVDIVGTNNAVIVLSGNSSAGFNFGQPGDYPSNTAQFQESSSVKFADITFKNTKETNENTNDIAYYMYANARNVVYSDCKFDRGVVVFGSARFLNCEITEKTESRYCIKFVSSTLNDTLGWIADSKLTADEQTNGCVLVEGIKQLFAVYDSDFYNKGVEPAVYVTGNMSLVTDGKNYFDSPGGGILTEEKDSCSFNGTDFYCPTKDDYLNADILTKSQMDRTEHGNNAAAEIPDANIPYVPVDVDKIPSAIDPDSIEESTDTKTYIIDSAEKFIAVMRMLNEKTDGVSKLSGNYKIILKKHIDLTAYCTEKNIWESVSINDGNTALKTLTIEADTEALGTPTAFIKGFNAPWFSHLVSSSSTAKMVLKDITTIHADMTLQTPEANTTYANAGIFISTALFSNGSVEIDNCHVLNSRIINTPSSSGEYSRTGAIVGYTNSANFTIRNCKVDTCVLTGASAGGIVGHASASQKKETYIIDCFVGNTEITCVEQNADWRVGEIIGTANQGKVIVVNPMVSGNLLKQEGVTDSHDTDDPYKTLYGRFRPYKNGGSTLTFVNNQGEIHEALLYGDFDPKAAQFLTSEEQKWLIYNTARLNTEMRFTGSNITVKSYYSGKMATLLLNSNVTTQNFAIGAAASSSGFNFQDFTKDTSFKKDSAIHFENLKIQNQKTYKTTTLPKADYNSYTYAFAENVSYKNCAFEDGVVVYGNAVFDTCTFETLRANDLCLILDNEGYDCTIRNCTFTAKEDAKSCVVSNGTTNLTVQSSEFKNSTEFPAIVLNGQTTVTTDTKNMFYSEYGGILAANAGSTFNGNACVTQAEYENADQLTKANYDKTEHGNNGGVKDPDLLIDYSKVGNGSAELKQDATTGAYLIETPEQFIAVMKMLNEKTDGVSTLSGDCKIILRTHIDFTDYLTDENVWQSVSLNIKNQSLKSLTIEADTEYLGTSTAFIKGLNAPLFDYVEATTGTVSIVLKDITIIDSDMNLTTKEVATSADSKYANSGIFMSSALLTKGSVSIINCHAVNSEIICTPNSNGEYSRLGGIIGYTNSADVLIQDCSVRGCSLTGASTGGIVGHASATKSRKTSIVNCFAENTTVCCVEAGADWRVGEIVGTANQGHVTISNPMVSGNTLAQDAEKPESGTDDPYRTLYGRFKPATAGGSTLIFINKQGERYEVSA